MVLIKPPEDWSDEISNRYDGPPPTPGIYKCTINGAWRTKVKEGSDNAGTDLILISVKIADGKFKGATVLTNLIMMKSSAWKINQFLVSLTDGSEKQIEALKKWFYQIGWNVSDSEPEKLGQRIIGIGKKFPIDDKPLFVELKNGTYEGAIRPEVDRFVVISADADDDDDDGEDDGIGEFTEPATESKPAVSAVPDPEPEPDGPPSEGDDDDDDPWS